MSGKRPSRWDKPSRWDRDFPVRKERSLKSDRNELADVRNARYHANDRSETRENVSHKDAPAGLIFMCSSLTKRDCFRYRVFGLPLARRDVVERVVPGTLLFLFDFDVRELYGIYEAVSFGGMNLEPNAFQDFEGSYPAQVRFDVNRECLPLSEDIFKDAIKENYYARNKFNFELSAVQVSKLIQLFCPIEPPRKRIDARRVPGRSFQADHSRLELVERNALVTDPVDLSHRGSQFRLPPQAARFEERFLEFAPLSVSQAQDGGQFAPLLPRKRLYEHDLIDPLASRALELPERRLLHIDTEGDLHRMLQMRHPYDGAPSDSAGLLGQSQLEEVDQLALKYIQSNPGHLDGRLGSLDSLTLNSVGPHRDYVDPRVGHFAILQQDPVYGGPVVGAAKLAAEGGAMKHRFRDQESNLQSMHMNPGLIAGSNGSALNMASLSSAAAVGRRNAAPESLMQPVGRGAVTRRS